MTAPKSALDRAMDLFVYAPVGFWVSARELLPNLVEKGRAQLGAQVNTARLVGELAVRQGQREAAKAFDRARAQAGTAVEGRGGAPEGAVTRPPVWPGAPAPPGTPVEEVVLLEEAAPVDEVAAAVEAAAVEAAAAAAPPPEVEAEPPAPDVPPVDTLPIPDYDALSASQVLPRLTGLAPEDLAAVRAYEAAHRGRKTILNRVAQLQER